MARICETVIASSMTELRRARDRATAADLVELRLDGVADLDVAGALEGRTKPVIVTCRPSWEGGAFRGGEDERLRILSEAVRQGAEFVDVEWRANRSALPGFSRTRLVVSMHDFDGVPADLDSRVRTMRAAAGTGVIKVAAATPALRDCVTLRDAVGHGRDQVVIGMGAAGVITRVCPWLFGSEWTYGGDAAPGQMSVVDLIGCYRLRHTTRATRIFALSGAPLVHSASPAMLNAAFAAAEIDAVYVPMESRDAAGFLAAARAFGVAGASVTAPLKTAFAPLGVAIGPVGRAIGAINTLKREGESWEGRNFDVDGFLAPLTRRGVRLADGRAVVLGAGGAARAVAWALAREGMRVEIAARRPDAARSLAAELGVEPSPWPPEPGWDLLVNATPVGTWPDADQAPLGPASLRGRLVYDLVYNPRETRLLHDARTNGAETIGGLEMLVAQAEAQFAYWTGRPAPAGVMAQAATAFLARWSA
jgi:3-dehydroquinate dehydratase / shikimate dehydrogenase